jgi:hypothetical protein
MNRELIGVMAKFDITQVMLSKVIHVSLPTLRKKLSNGFNQKEMQKIIEYLQKYDSSIDEHIFFAN